MIITPTTTPEQEMILANNNLTADDLLKTLIEYKINWMKDRPAYVYNNCSLIVDPSGGSVTLTTGQENFLGLDFGSNSIVEPVDPISKMEMWVQNFIDDTCRRLYDGKGLII